MTRALDRAAVDAEAACWLAKLQSGGQTEGLQAWLNSDPYHRAAFGRVCEIWDLLPGAVQSSIDYEGCTPNFSRPQSPEITPTNGLPWGGRGRFRSTLVIAAALVILLILTPMGTMRIPRYETATGETRVVRLEDGSRVSLNTNSLVVVDYNIKKRLVRLVRGEALFEVSKDARRPFIVVHDGGAVRALGTVFVVRDEPRRTSVTLIEGRVEVTPNTSRAGKGTFKGVILSPGERITLTADTNAIVDHPPLNIVTAWRQDEIMFDDTSLADAATEFNRYIHGTEIVVDPLIASLKLSGVFSTHSPLQFAETVAALHNIHIKQESHKILITR